MGKREIVIGKFKPQQIALGIREHTILHELRELIEAEFRRLGCGTASGPHLELKAEEFASSARMMAPLESWKPVANHLAENVSGWRFLGVLMVCVLVFGIHAIGCFTLPALEDRIQE